MAFFIQSTSQVQKTFIPGTYTAISPISITSTVGGVEVLAASDNPKYVILNVSGEECFLSIGGTPTDSAYSLKLKPGDMIVDWLIYNQALKAITASGKTATIQIQTASLQAINVG
ncbi:MAG: hypothetical protein ACOVQ7_15530 [Limnoraphis robusta]|jgi:hypothetical protein